MAGERVKGVRVKGRRATRRAIRHSLAGCRVVPAKPGRIEAPVSGAIGEWPPGASIRLRWRGATRQPAALSPFPFSFFIFPFSFLRATGKWFLFPKSYFVGKASRRDAPRLARHANGGKRTPSPLHPSRRDGIPLTRNGGCHTTSRLAPSRRDGSTPPTIFKCPYGTFLRLWWTFHSRR